MAREHHLSATPNAEIGSEAIAGMGPGRVLAAVGITEDEERLYGALLDHSGAGLAKLADYAKLSVRRARRVLAWLEMKGLASHSPDRPRRYFPTPPDVAINALVLRQQEALQHVQAAAFQLQERAQAGEVNDPKERPIEVITGRAAQTAIFEQLQRAARKEVIGFDRPPYVWSASTKLNQPELEVLRRGVRNRAVYDRSSLEIPGALETIRAYADAGEEARIFPSVPLKFFAVDRRAALLPLDSQRPSGAALLVRSSSLLDALYDLFEAIWDRAMPLMFSGTGKPAILDPDTRLPREANSILAHMVAGLNDKSIAYEMSISSATFNRRIAQIMKSLDAKTRFQLGWIVARRFDKLPDGPRE